MEGGLQMHDDWFLHLVTYLIKYNLYPTIGGLLSFFLYFNKSPARVFMGDVKSTF